MSDLSALFVIYTIIYLLARASAIEIDWMDGWSAGRAAALLGLLKLFFLPLAAGSVSVVEWSGLDWIELRTAYSVQRTAYSRYRSLNERRCGSAYVQYCEGPIIISYAIVLECLRMPCREYAKCHVLRHLNARNSHPMREESCCKSKI